MNAIHPYTTPCPTVSAVCGAFLESRRIGTYLPWVTADECHSPRQVLGEDNTNG